LVRIECHFNVPVPLTTYRHGCFARDGQSFQNRLVLDLRPSRILWKGEPRQLTAFSPKAAGVRRFSTKSDDSRCG
jgi:hypothetical protein